MFPRSVQLANFDIISWVHQSNSAEKIFWVGVEISNDQYFEIQKLPMLKC